MANAVRDIARQLRSFESSDPVEIRRKTLDLCRVAARADFSLFYNVAEIDGVRRVTDCQVENAAEPARVESALRSLPHESHAMVNVTDPDPSLETFWPVRKMFPRDLLEASALYQMAWKPFGVDDNLGMLVYHGRQVLGAFCQLRVAGRPWFDDADVRRMAPLVPVVRSAITAAHFLALRGVPQEPAYVLFDGDANVRSASKEGEAWLARAPFRRMLESFVQDFAAGRSGRNADALDRCEARVVRIETQEGARWLACLRRSEMIVRSSEAMLTRQQREVAKFAAAGATASEIASALDRKTATVRAHLREIYRKLGVASRVDLARVLGSDGQRAASAPK